MTSLSRFRRLLYHGGRDLGDIEAAASDDPRKVAKWAVRRRVSREERKLTRRWLRKFGL
jgi:hypothetical protein